MSASWRVRSAVVGGLCVCAVAVGSGVASAAYLGPSGGITTGGGGESVFSGGGFAPNSVITISATYCGTTQTLTTTAGADGAFSVPITAAGSVSYVATGTNSDGTPATLTTSAVLGVACAGGAATATTVPQSGGLPFTGFELGLFSVVGVAAVGGGATLVLVSRKRRRSPELTSV